MFAEIAKARPPKLLVIADGPRADHPDDAEKCAAVRAIIDGVDWDCEVLTNYSDENLGCKRRVSSGLDWVFDTVDDAIVLEDERIVYMYQDGEAPVKDEKSVDVNLLQGRRSVSRLISRYSTRYDPVAVGEEIETMEEAWDALKSCKYSEIRLVFPGEEVGYSFYPEKEFKRDNALIFVDYLTAIDESQ